MVIVYKRYSFKEPAPITHQQYLYLRQQLMASPGFEINADFKTTFSSHYKKTLRWLLIGLLVLAGSIAIYRTVIGQFPEHYGWPEFLEIILIIAAGATVFATFLRIVLEGPSMATYLTNRKIYFCRMKYAIRHHADYPGFYTVFYGDGKNKSAKAPFHQEALAEQKKARATADLFFTRVFYWIDRYLWMITLAGFAIFFIWKYLIK